MAAYHNKPHINIIFIIIDTVSATRVFCRQGRRQKIFQGEGRQRKKNMQDRKIAPLSLPLLYQYHV